MKCRIDKEALIKIIESSDFIVDCENSGKSNETLKKLLKDMVSGLCRYNEETMKAIGENVLYKKHDHGIGKITAALIEKTTDEELKRLCDTTGLHGCGINKELFFIDADYPIMREIVGDNQAEKFFDGVYTIDNTEHTFKYRLVFDDTYLKMQDLVYRLSDIYTVENAILYFPYMRKSFRVLHLDDIPKDSKIDYRFERNGIGDVVLKNRLVLWNLIVTHMKDVKKADAKVPYGNEERYKFHFCKSRVGNYLYVIPKNNQVIIYDVSFTDDGTDIVIDHEMEEFTIVECSNIDNDNGGVARLKRTGVCFDNALSGSILRNRRIISNGDIEYAVRSFRNNNGYKCEIVRELDNVCVRYSSKYKSTFANRADCKRIKTVRIKFTADDRMKFNSDYINYVLAYLSYYYPEIEWVGGE